MTRVRVTTGTVVAFVIVAGAIVLAAVALLVRPPPPSQRAPQSRPAVSAKPSSLGAASRSFGISGRDRAPHLIPEPLLSIAEEA